MMRRLGVLIVLVVLGLATAPYGFLVSAQDNFPAGAPCGAPPCGSEQAAAEYVPGELLVRFRPAVSRGRAAQVLAAEGAVPSRRIPALDVVVLRLPPGLPVEEAVERFGRRPEVQYAEPNYILHAAQVTDPGLDNQWAPQKIQAADRTGELGAWRTTTGDPDVVIAIVDSGVDYRHSELAPNMWTNPDEIAGNGLDDDNNGYVDDVKGWDFINTDNDPLDDCGHGTHVAGIAAADDNSNPDGLVGICPDCTLMPVKVLNSEGAGSLDVVANGITYAADNGAQVVNLSLGGAMGTQVLEDAVDYAWGAGVVVVAAAGNDGAKTLFYPAAYANAMAVASTDADDLRSCYSNFSPNFIDVAAPGEGIHSSKPLDEFENDTYGTHSGTSMAAPHVSGLAGLLFSLDPPLTGNQVRARIQDTTEDLGPAGEDAYFGTGRINAYRAIEGDTSATTPPAVSLPATNLTASGYAHARKLARDDSGKLHLAWHAQEGSEYRVLYATSSDDGANWSTPEVVFASTAETYHPALALDDAYVYVVFPSKDGADLYRTFFTLKPVSGGSWLYPPEALTDSDHDAVRPDVFVDPSNGRLHVVASSLDNAPYVYYTSSDDQGQSWTPVVDLDYTKTGFQGNTRYATVHANHPNVYIAARTVNSDVLYTYFYTHFARSVDGGQEWNDNDYEKLASYTVFTFFGGSEYGLSLAGVGDRLYMGYEVGGNLYFRRYDEGSWGDPAYELLETSGKWPTITQGGDGQAWMIWEDAGSLKLRHYTGSAWEPAETLLESNPFNKGFYPNLKLGSSGDRVEWVYTSCKGAPFSLKVDGPPTVSIQDPVEDQTLVGTYRVLVSASDNHALTTVELSIDGGDYVDITNSFDDTYYFYDWDTTGDGNGDHTLQARATDDAARSTESAIVNVTSGAPTAVQVASLSAQRQGDAVLVTWETASEVDILGFNVHRSRLGGGPRRQVNEALIEAVGHLVGATYRFLDESAAPGASYAYWLEVVDVYGRATLHGPVMVGRDRLYLPLLLKGR